MNNENQIMLSVRLMTYNHESYIVEALDGINKQKTNFKFEVVIGDDFSTDNTLKIIKAYKFNNDNLIVNILDRNSGDEYDVMRQKRGRLYNFTNIIKNCKGKYIALLDGDDYWTDPLKLQKQMDFLEENDDYVLCFHKVSILKTDGSIVDDFITRAPENYETIETLARLGNYIHTPSVVFRNILAEFPYEYKLSPIGDSFLYILLAEHGKLGYLDEIMAVYRHGVGIYSVTTQLGRIKQEVIMLGCLLSHSKNENIKKILLDRYFLLIDEFQKCVESVKDENLISEPFIIRVINFTCRNYKQPKKILSMVYRKILKGHNK